MDYWIERIKASKSKPLFLAGAIACLVFDCIIYACGFLYIIEKFGW